MTPGSTRTGARRLMAVFAHPDDESLGAGGALAKCAAEGIEVFVVTATSGEAGRYHGHRRGDPAHPGSRALADIRAAELRRAAAVLGVRDVTLLHYPDGALDGVDPCRVIGSIVTQLRRVRPDVVVTFGPEGAYGHPDHVAISQFTTAATIAAADASFACDDAGAEPSHVVSKLYYIAWPATTWAVYQSAIGTLSATVDGVERQAMPWPEWAISAVIDTRSVAATVARAVSCHASQITARESVEDLSPERQIALWGRQSFYRAFSTVNGGRGQEASLFEGISS